MSDKLNGAMDIIGRRLDEIRAKVFKREFRDQMKLTFIARDPRNPESDMFVSEDDIEDVIDLLRRTVDRASDRNPKGGDANAAPGRSPESAVPSGTRPEPSSAGERQPATPEVPQRLWLWKNFVDGRPEYWAFDNPFPVHLDNGDPQTLGEPCGYALVKASRTGRTDVSDEEVLRRIAVASARELHHG